MMKLKNHEKVVVIDAVEDKYPLHQRLKCQPLCMAKSSYCFRVTTYYERRKLSEVNRDETS